MRAIGLVLLTAVAAIGCKSWTNEMDTKMITRNSFSEYMGMKQMLRDVDECGTYAVTERYRLIGEVTAGDAYFEEQARREAAGGTIGREIGREMAEPSSGYRSGGGTSANGQINSERMAGAAGAAAGGFLIGVLTYDVDKHEQNMLIKDLENVHTYIRFKHTCLRTKGYEVSEYEEDGARPAFLEPEPLRIVFRGEDGSELVMYQRPRAGEE